MAMRDSLTALGKDIRAEPRVHGGTLKRAADGVEWLKHTGLYAGRTLPLPSELQSEPLPGWCLEHYRRLAPLQQWLVEILRE
jgi:hypothetical protein